MNAKATLGSFKTKMMKTKLNNGNEAQPLVVYKLLTTLEPTKTRRRPKPSMPSPNKNIGDKFQTG